jgi:adenylate cyclase
VDEAEQIPRIMVLPFRNIGSNTEDDYFIDGITEDIITDLSRLSGLLVLASNTSFIYKGQTVLPQDIGKELNVSHLLEGSVRKAGEKIRITAQLVDTRQGHHLWAERYDKELVDVFAVQDDVANSIVSALALHLTDQDRLSLGHNDTDNIQAYELFLQGQNLFRQRTKEANRQAQETYKQAIELDPAYARSYGGLAISLTGEVNAGWSNAPTEARDRALELARKAVSIDKLSQHAYWALGFVHLYRKEHEDAARAVQEAIKISPSYADGYGLLALIKNQQGLAEDAIDLLNKGMQLNPHYTWDYLYNLGWAYYILGEYEKAVEYEQQALNRNANARVARLTLIAAYAALDMLDEAEWEVDLHITAFPNNTLTYLEQESPITDATIKQKYLDDLRKAGMPEE